jgi:hypothetical protein
VSGTTTAGISVERQIGWRSGLADAGRTASYGGRGMTHQRAPLWLSEASWRDRVPIPGRGMAAAGMTRDYPRHTIDIVVRLDAPMILSTVQSIPGPSPVAIQSLGCAKSARAERLAAGAAKWTPGGYFSAKDDGGGLQEPIPPIAPWGK